MRSTTPGRCWGARTLRCFPNFLRAAAGNFSTFSVPGSDSTLFGAINNAGTVAGTFVAGGLQHGFLRDAAGNFTTFDIPGAKGIGVEAINDLGMVAGIFTAGGLQQGFLRDAAGNVTAFDPLPSGLVVDVSLNNAGVLAGTIFLPTNSDNIGFIGTPAAAVPAPPSIVLLGLGVAGLAIGRRQHRGKSGVGSSFLPEKMNRHRITCRTTRKDELPSREGAPGGLKRASGFPFPL